MIFLSNARPVTKLPSITACGQEATASARRMAALALILLLVAAPNYCYAKKGGNGGGPGGGDPPVVLPVSYAVTPIAMPGNRFIYSDHNEDEDTAVVGWIYDTPVGRRATAYLPSISENQVVYLDELVDMEVILPGWHTRSAIGINIHGTIVGNLEPFGAEDTATKPFLLETSGAAPPQLSVLGPFDPSAEK
jgi:hypothetical protein